MIDKRIAWYTGKVVQQFKRPSDDRWDRRNARLRKYKVEMNRRAEALRKGMRA